MRCESQPVHDEQLLHRIRSEYLEMPGLQLTRGQAQRFFGLSEHVCTSLLAALVEHQFLVLRPDGRYALRSEERVSAPRRMLPRARPAESLRAG